MKFALVHPNTLVGKEVRQQLEARAATFDDVRLLSTIEGEIGAVTEYAGAAAFVGRADAEGLDSVDLAFFCGALEADRAALAHLPAEARAILLSPGATTEDAPPAVAGIARAARAGQRRLTSPHPAAVALALLVAPLERFRPRRVVATVALPVTAESDTALDDLFEESRRILTFQSPPPSVRSRGQRAFNLLPVEPADDRIESQVGAVLGHELPVGIQLVRAGVFHGMVAQVWIDLEERPDPAELRKTLAGGAVELARKPGAVGPVAVAGNERLVVGSVRSAAGSYGVWAAMDNLVRGAALNAVELAEEMLGEIPS
ncbi:MAG TPA: hypothetical protein VI942_01035 [Thermoanaerobaculia bacterium]|nr:hypothetical protein [Thermoanaerobaculia bacterium]